MTLKSETADSQPENSSALDAIVAEYLLAVEQGKQPDRDEYVKNHPNFAKALRSFFADLDATCIVSPTSIVARDHKTEIVINARYRLINEIGEGGMGSVWSADQLQPVKRRVAIKLIKAGTDSREVMARFDAERQALAMMDHENIAKVFDAGTTEDRRPYFVMELVNGIPITDYCDKFKLSLAERLALFNQCCKAIQHAHQKGVIHRDIKPSNVLVSQQDGVAVVKVIDFGLAKALNVGSLSDDPTFTQQGQILGTLRYMSPEQAEMLTLDIDTRTDVFSLGVVLYELLTGSTPIKKDRIGKTPVSQVLAAIREEEAPRPSSRLSSLGNSASEISSQRQSNPRKLGLIMKGDLDWIAMKALEKDRTRRYDSPAQMAEDVQRYLNNEAIFARPPSFTYRLKKVTRKYRVAVSTAALTVSLLIAGIVATTTQMFRAQKAETATGIKAEEARRESERAGTAETVARQERDKAKAAEAAAIKSEAETEKTLARANYFLAIDRWQDNLAGDAINYLEKIPRAHRHFEWHLARNEFEGSELTLYGHTGPVRCMDFSPDGSTIASVGIDQKAKLWNAIIGEEILAFSQSVATAAIRFSPDGTMLAGIDGEKSVVIWNALNGTTIREFAKGQYKVGEPRWSTGTDEIDWSPDGTTLATPGTNHNVKLWNVSSGDEIRTLIGHTAPVTSVAFSPDGKQLVSASLGVAIVWDVASGNAVSKVTRSGGTTSCVSFSPDGKLIALVGYDSFGLWDAVKSQMLIECHGHSKAIEQCVFSHDGVTIATASQDSKIKLWDVVTGKELRTLNGHQGGVNNISFSSNGGRLASASSDGTVKIWNVTDLRGVRNTATNVTSQIPITSLSFRSDGHQLASSSVSGVSLWETLTGQLLRTITSDAPLVPVQSVAFRPKSSLLAAGDVSGTIRLWDADSGLQLGKLEGHENAVPTLNFSRDGRLLASGSIDNSARIWNVDALKEILTLRSTNEKKLLNNDGSLAGHMNGVLGVSFAPDGMQLATIGGEGAIFLWDVESGERVKAIDQAYQSIQVHSDRCVRFSPDGRYLVANKSQHSTDDSIPIWNAATGQEVNRAAGSSADVLCLTVSPDSSRIAAGSRDNSFRIWDTETGELLRRCDGHSGWVTALEFSPDGDLLASAGTDSTIQLWNAFPQYEVTAFKGHSRLVESAAISPDARWILSGSTDTSMKLWDTSTGQLIRTIEAYPNTLRGVSAVRLSPDGTRAISAGWAVSTQVSGAATDIIKLWDLTTGQQLPLTIETAKDNAVPETVATQDQAQEGHYFAQTTIMGAISFSPDSTRLVTIGPKMILHIWDATTGTRLFSLPEFQTVLSTAGFSPLSDRLVVKDAEGHVTVWNSKTGEPLQTTESDLDVASADVVYDKTPDGRWKVVPRGNDVLLIDQHFKATEHERKRREAAARPKIRWHEEQRSKAIQSGNEFAEAFHQSWLEKYSQQETHRNDVTARSRPSLAPLLTKSDRPTIQSQFAESSLHLLKTDDYQSNNPFTKMNAMYVEQGRAIIRSDGGWWGWNVGSLAENQVLKAKVRVRRNTSGRVGICLTQEGDRPGAVVWLSGDQTVTRAASMFAKIKPQQLDREFYAPDIVHPAEEWNEVQLALQHGSLHIFVNDLHVDTMEFLSSEAPTRANVAFSIQATAAGTMVEMEEYSIHVIESKLAQSIWPDDAPTLAVRDFDAEQAKRHQEEWAKYLGVPVEYTNSIGMKFRLIPPCEFLMGSSEQEIAANLQLVGPDDVHTRNCVTSEGPQHLVRLTRPYYISVHEVTQKNYMDVLGTNPSHFSSSGEGRDAVQNVDTSQFPVENVNYDDAVAFFAKLQEMEPGESPSNDSRSKYRLPSEAEWEFAARAGLSTSSVGTPQNLTQPNSRQSVNSQGRTGPVAEYPPNAFGLHDTVGNVWEWCVDSWSMDDFKSQQFTVSVDPVRTPTLPGMRMTKGGSWRDTPLFCRPTDRHSAGDDFRYFAIGFRCLIEVRPANQ